MKISLRDMKIQSSKLKEKKEFSSVTPQHSVCNIMSQQNQITINTVNVAITKDIIRVQDAFVCVVCHVKQCLGNGMLYHPCNHVLCKDCHFKHSTSGRCEHCKQLIKRIIHIEDSIGTTLEMNVGLLDSDASDEDDDLPQEPTAEGAMNKVSNATVIPSASSSVPVNSPTPGSNQRNNNTSVVAHGMSLTLSHNHTLKLKRRLLHKNLLIVTNLLLIYI